MKSLIFLPLCFCINAAFSQVVLTNASNGYVPGYSAWLYFNWSVNAGYYPASANYTNAPDKIWDLHDMTILIGQQLDYNYCAFDSTQISPPLGACVINTDDYIIAPSYSSFIYNVPDTLMKFPLQLGDQFGGLFHAVNPVSTPTYFRTVYGSRITTADAHGKLILPYASYNDVLRLKIVTEFIDTTHNDLSDSVYKMHSIQYRWYSPLQREYLLTIDTTYSFNTVSATSYQKSIMSGFVLAAPLAVNDPSNYNGVKIYPNPATSELTITCPESITGIAITNLLGQIVYTHRYSSQQVHINVADLPEGVYFVRINGSEVRKFIRQ